MKQQGMTLIELMITLSLLAIATAIATPSFVDLIARNNIQTSIKSFGTAIKFARTAAVTKSTSVTICASDNQATCTGTWENGWIIFSDLNSDGIFNSGSDSLINVHEALKTGLVLSFSGATSSITFSSKGYTNNQTGTFKLCGPQHVAMNASGFILQRIGSVRFAADINSNGVREDDGGNDFVCP